MDANPKDHALSGPANPAVQPRLAITMGDTNGIGPEILAKVLARPDLARLCAPVVFGSPPILREAARLVGTRLNLRECRQLPESSHLTNDIPVVDCGFPAPPWNPGALAPEASRCAVEWLKSAIVSTKAGEIDGIVTCPINKEGIQEAGYNYMGHTEILADLTKTNDYRMCLFAGSIRVVHISSHCPMAEAIKMVTRDRIARSIRIAHAALVRLGLKRRRVAVAGLNPHAGEAGVLGTEEAAEIAPAVETCRKEDIDCSGPYPPDTVFKRMVDGEFDLVVAMYHDQGHIPVKLIAMDQGVNVTLGIPIVRTSVDHGTAYDIAGTGRARPDSLYAAIRLAAQLVSSQEHTHA
jgi:4-hydroxythreonine-4-phosphate dehydrogenase